MPANTRACGNPDSRDPRVRGTKRRTKVASQPTVRVARLCSLLSHSLLIEQPACTLSRTHTYTTSSAFDQLEPFVQLYSDPRPSRARHCATRRLRLGHFESSTSLTSESVCSRTHNMDSLPAASPNLTTLSFEVSLERSLSLFNDLCHPHIRA